MRNPLPVFAPRRRANREDKAISTPTPTPPSLNAAGELTIDEQLKLIETTLDMDKATDIITIDLEGKSSVCDFLVIASGTSNRHVGALADHLGQELKKAGIKDLVTEGQPTCDWVLVDSGHVIVHLFRPEVREFYNLEKMWGVEGPQRPSEAEGEYEFQED